MAKLDAGTVTKCNFAGDKKAGDSWTDNIFATKSKNEQEDKGSSRGEGAEEDEWVSYRWKMPTSQTPIGKCV